MAFFIQLVAKYIVVNIFDAAFYVIFKNAASAAAIFDDSNKLPPFSDLTFHVILNKSRQIQ